jgi:ubiquinone/menaquinone biosynthesis C-methylase UbiE
MGRLMAAVYDRTMEATEESCLRQWRADLLRDLSGSVLEIGAGTGLNVPYYPTKVSRLVLAEPDPHMRRRLAARVAEAHRDGAEILDATADHLPMAGATFDAVVATLVLCSVPRVDAALAEIRRVLKPGGRFVFLEHVAAEGLPRRLRWQRIVEPFWKRISGNCHLTRRTEAAIAGAGFTFAEIKRESMRKVWPLVRRTVRGVAVRG